ncbi:hypothetical protein ACWPM1_01110 [Tsuneonella sp. HG249]
MRLRRGPRPTAIRWFAVLFLSGSITVLIDGIIKASGHAEGPTRDIGIILSAAKFTIALLTAGLVWYFAMRIARWFVPLSVAAKIALVGFSAMRSGVPALIILSPLVYLSTALGAAAAVMLFTAGGRKWFQQPRTVSDAFS